MPEILLTGLIVNTDTHRGLDGVTVEILWNHRALVSAETMAQGEFSAKVGVPDNGSPRYAGGLTFRISRREKDLPIIDQHVSVPSQERVSVRIAVEVEPKTVRPAFAPLQIASYRELLHAEPEILQRIRSLPNGGNLFLIHPFLLFEDIGVELVRELRSEILAQEPSLAGLSEEPYYALKRSNTKQSYRITLQGLFKRRTA